MDKQIHRANAVVIGRTHMSCRRETFSQTLDMCSDTHILAILFIIAQVELRAYPAFFNIPFDKVRGEYFIEVEICR